MVLIKRLDYLGYKQEYEPVEICFLFIIITVAILRTRLPIFRISKLVIKSNKKTKIKKKTGPNSKSV